MLRSGQLTDTGPPAALQCSARGSRKARHSGLLATASVVAMYVLDVMSGVAVSELDCSSLEGQTRRTPPQAVNQHVSRTQDVVIISAREVSNGKESRAAPAAAPVHLGRGRVTHGPISLTTALTTAAAGGWKDTSPYD